MFTSNIFVKFNNQIMLYSNKMKLNCKYYTNEIKAKKITIISLK